MTTATLASIWDRPYSSKCRDGEADDVRQHSIRHAGMLLTGHWIHSDIARLAGIAPKTLYNTLHRLLGDDQPDTEGLRRLARDKGWVRLDGKWRQRERTA